MWDWGSNDDTTAQKFLGEVILNLAKLVPYNNQFIEQKFEIKQGKLHKITAEDKQYMQHLTDHLPSLVVVLLILVVIVICDGASRCRRCRRL